MAPERIIRRSVVVVTLSMVGEGSGREGMALRPLTVMTSREKRPATDADATP